MLLLHEPCVGRSVDDSTVFLLQVNFHLPPAMQGKSSKDFMDELGYLGPSEIVNRDNISVLALGERSRQIVVSAQSYQEGAVLASAAGVSAQAQHAYQSLRSQQVPEHTPVTTVVAATAAGAYSDPAEQQRPPSAPSPRALAVAKQASALGPKQGTAVRPAARTSSTLSAGSQVEAESPSEVVSQSHANQVLAAGHADDEVPSSVLTAGPANLGVAPGNEMYIPSGIESDIGHRLQMLR